MIKIFTLILALFLYTTLSLDVNASSICCEPGARAEGTNCVTDLGRVNPMLVCNMDQSCIFNNGVPQCTGGTFTPSSSINGVFGTITPPAPVTAIGPGAQGISNFLTNVVTLIYTVSAIAVLFMVVWGAFEWIISGGDKEKVAGARKRITYALIGLLLLSLSFVLLRVFGQITGFEFYQGQNIGTKP